MNLNFGIMLHLILEMHNEKELSKVLRSSGVKGKKSKSQGPVCLHYNAHVMLQICVS